MQINTINTYLQKNVRFFMCIFTLPVNLNRQRHHLWGYTPCMDVL